MTANKLGWSAQARAHIIARYTQSEVDSFGAVSVPHHRGWFCFDTESDGDDDAVGEREAEEYYVITTKLAGRSTTQ